LLGAGGESGCLPGLRPGGAAILGKLRKGCRPLVEDAVVAGVRLGVIVLGMKDLPRNFLGKRLANILV
jgi:hypothetical protein